MLLFGHAVGQVYRAMLRIVHVHLVLPHSHCLSKSILMRQHFRVCPHCFLSISIVQHGAWLQLNRIRTREMHVKVGVHGAYMTLAILHEWDSLI
jgi:hypothetical protein